MKERTNTLLGAEGSLAVECRNKLSEERHLICDRSSGETGVFPISQLCQLKLARVVPTLVPIGYLVKCRWSWDMVWEYI